MVKEKAATIKVTLVKSRIARLPDHKKCLTGLGLGKRGDTVEVQDTPSNRGMMNKVAYLLDFEGNKAR